MFQTKSITTLLFARRNFSYAIFVFVFVSSSILCVHMRPLSCAADKFADGCSVPLAFPAPFKNEFTSACNRHDICYGCGHHYNWSRSACDDAFYKNMKLKCEHIRTRRSLVGSLLDIWNTFSSIGRQTTHCKGAAKMYYEGVHLFAGSHFDVIDHDYCQSRCAFNHGNPEFNITFGWNVINFNL